MAAARYSSDVLQMFYGPITEQENADLPQPLQPDVVVIEDMVVSEENEHNNDFLFFARENKEKFINVVKNEIEELRSVNVSFGLKAEFSILRNDEMETMEHYIQED